MNLHVVQNKANLLMLQKYGKKEVIWFLFCRKIRWVVFVLSNVSVCFSEVKYINKIDVYITNKYLEGTFNSCSKVSVPSTGQLALDIMCGEWGASRCTPLKWFHYMGDAENNVYVPFQITYKNTDEPVGPFTPIDPIITPCNKPINVSI